MTGVLVGPVPVIRFMDGTRQVYEPPRNTMDIRYAACTVHHPACDCREAEFAENLGEYRSERFELEAAFFAELQDHATFPPWTGGDPDANFNVCSCSGCRIARRVRFIRTSFDTERDRRACRPASPEPDMEIPF